MKNNKTTVSNRKLENDLIYEKEMRRFRKSGTANKILNRSN